MSEQSLYTAEVVDVESFYQSLTAELETVTDWEGYIQGTLLPAMDAHRGRTEPATTAKVLSRLFSTNPDKPGEWWEFKEAREIAASQGQQMTPELALEIADLVYFMEQPGGRHLLYRPDKDGRVVADPGGQLAEEFGVSIDTARMFCAVKYKTRIHFTPLVSDEDRKLIETDVMKSCLELDGVRRG